MVRLTTDAFASVAKPGKGGFVRDCLTAAYPRLAGQVEAMFERLTSETTIKVGKGGRRGAIAGGSHESDALIRVRASAPQGVLPAVGPAQLHQLLCTHARKSP